MIKPLIASGLLILLAMFLAIPYSVEGAGGQRAVGENEDGLRRFGCFDSDPNVGVTDRDAHLRWAQEHAQALPLNLSKKVILLFNCSSIDNEKIAKAFGQMSVTVANYVPRAACFGDDVAVIGKDASAHERWARARTRDLVRDNLKWKIQLSLDCMDARYRNDFFADISVIVANAGAGTTTGGGGGTGGGSGGTIGGGGVNPWSQEAQSIRGKNGQKFSFYCPAGSGGRGVWGTDIYTDDSSICLAAVHAGIITYTSGGNVTIVAMQGQAGYTGTSRNGVSSGSYGQWTGSFYFVR